ncbi:MAG TPA: cytochrome d ubiquinol oxidase subunit II [Epsilonproteobacteria bacterium]|nr:cytochrome d ubiquinol oxidase subunit II [Campylobacterota bacterium]
MLDSISLLTLQTYWWLIVSLLGALFVFMTLVQGGQTLLYTLGKTDDERSLIINSLGRKWELTFTTLVMFGGALFAAFPLFYAVSFGGAYYVWMAILFCFIIQAVSYEYRKKPDNVFGEKFYEKLLFINGSLGVFLLGVALATLYTGGNFVVNEMHLSHWTQASYGLEALLNPFNVSFGIMLVFLSRIQASLYFYNNLDNEAIAKRIMKSLKNNTFIFLPFFLFVFGFILFEQGYSYTPETQMVFIEPRRFLHTLMHYPFLGVILLTGLASLLYGIYSALYKQNHKAIWFTGTGTVLVVTILLFMLGFDHTAYYPSLVDLQSSLTIENSSGSHYTLAVMSIVSLLVPVVLGYIFLVWRSMDKNKMTIEEVNADTHHY